MVKQNEKESLSLRFLYGTAFGRVILKLLISPAFSKIAGKYLDSRASKLLINSFVKKNNINLNEYHSDDFKCFNDCFSRRIKDGLRPIESAPDALISPCDAFLSAYKITEDSIVNVKGSEYTISDLLENESLAKKYDGGVCLVFRLCVHHYHRYIYIDNAVKNENVFIPGRLHTVRPIALRTCPVFKQNSREYTIMETENFGSVTQIEVGALLVGKIKNHHNAAIVKRGEEKGTFLYGGSTIILLLEKDVVDIPEELFLKTDKDEEVSVLLGSRIGTRNNQ